MKIEKLKSKHEGKLNEFFLGLGSNTIFFMNRFGKVNKKAIAEKTANAQTTKNQKEEIGYVAKANNKIIGYGFLRFFPKKPLKKYTCSFGLMVSDKYQGKGAGRKLTTYIVNQAKKLGMRKIWLATYSHNTKAINLYVKQGFVVEGVFFNNEYYKGKPLHEISMAKFLD